MVMPQPDVPHIAVSGLSSRGGTCELFGEEGVVGLGSGHIGTQELRAERRLPLSPGRRMALLVH